MSGVERCHCGEPIADCVHLGVFRSYEEKARHYRAKPERVAAMRRLDEIGKACGELADRLRLADAAHDLGHIAQDLGAELPAAKDITQIADSVATFGPLAGNVPFIAKNPAASTALGVMVDAAKLLLRALTGR